MPNSPQVTNSPRLTPAKRREQTAREVRLAEALRENLRRRKEQARNRTAGSDAARRETQEQDTETEPSDRPPGTTGLSD